MNLFHGLAGLMQSRKASAFLLISTISTVLVALGKIDSTAYAAIIATTFPAVMAAHAYQQCNNPIPPKGTL